MERGTDAALEISRFGASGGSGGSGGTSEKRAMSHDMIPRCRVKIKLRKRRVKQLEDTPTAKQLAPLGPTHGFACGATLSFPVSSVATWQVCIFPDLPLRSAPKDMNEYDSSVDYTQHVLISDVIVRLAGVL